MKIRPVTAEHHARVYALLRQAFAGSSYEETLVRQFHENGTPIHEWACLQRSKVIAYLAFSNAYHGREVCGLHLAPMAVSPEFQRQGVGSEMLRFALRQEAVATRPLFVLGHPAYYRRFGFEPCRAPLCPYDKNNAHFLSMRNSAEERFTVGYEPEFRTAGKASSRRGGKRR